MEPFRQICTPLNATSMRSGSKSAAVVPMAASTRPQLGSCPKTAHLKRLVAGDCLTDLHRVSPPMLHDAPRWR